MIENDEIAVDVAHGNCLRVGQGAWCLIGQVVAGGDDAPGRGGEDARAVAHPASHFLQVAHRQPPLGVGPHEVDGEPLGVEQLAVDGLNRAAMDPRVATATVDDEPAPALERRPEDVGLPRRQRKWGQAVLDRRWRLCCRADRRERLDPVVEEPGDRARRGEVEGQQDHARLAGREIEVRGGPRIQRAEHAEELLTLEAEEPGVVLAVQHLHRLQGCRHGLGIGQDEFVHDVVTPIRAMHA